MGQKGNLAVFESSNIFETGETMPTKFDVHAFFGFWDIGIFKNGQISLLTHGL